jgi:hypothetical protein
MSAGCGEPSPMSYDVDHDLPRHWRSERNARLKRDIQRSIDAGHAALARAIDPVDRRLLEIESIMNTNINRYFDGPVAIFLA